MTETYSLYLTESVEDSAHPIQHDPILVGLAHEDAFQACIALQPYLRDGIEAHCVSED